MIQSAIFVALKEENIRPTAEFLYSLTGTTAKTHVPTCIPTRILPKKLTRSPVFTHLMHGKLLILNMISGLKVLEVLKVLY